jgi:hypothetical protein
MVKYWTSNRCLILVRQQQPAHGHGATLLLCQRHNTAILIDGIGKLCVEAGESG